MKNADLSPLWSQLRQLFEEQHFLTIVCGFVIVILAVKFYRFLRSLSPALVPIVLVLVVFILVIHWTQTRTEPALLTPVVDWIALRLPIPRYQP